MKRLATLALALLVMSSGTALAQDTGDFSAGYRFLRTDGVNFGTGWYVDVAGHVTEVVSIVGEVAGTYKSFSETFQGITVEADAVRIKEVLANLLANALSHTPAGGSVRLALTNAADAVSVSVADTGSGMSADDVARMFDRFYKGRNSRGAGLGLAIARNLIGAHGGHIMATSVLGKGTTVKFTLPAQPSPTAI